MGFFECSASRNSRTVQNVANLTVLFPSSSRCRLCDNNYPFSTTPNSYTARFVSVLSATTLLPFFPPLLTMPSKFTVNIINFFLLPLVQHDCHFHFLRSMTQQRKRAIFTLTKYLLYLYYYNVIV